MQSSETIEGLQRVEQPLKDALQNFGRLERMISELLDYSRIQADKFLLRKQPANLVEIVRAAVEDVQKTGGERTIVLTLPAQEEVAVFVDKDRIGDVVHNFSDQRA